MNLQYFHGRKTQFFKEFTVCVDVPSKQLLLSHINDIIMGRLNSIPIPVGFTEVNPKDQYNKQTGRTLSLERTRTRDFKLMSVYQDTENNSVKVILDSDSISLSFELKVNRQKVHFVKSTVFLK